MHEIMNNLKKYLEWADSLSSLTEQQADAPYQEGRWSPKEILMHMAEWDRFTLEHRLRRLGESEILEDVEWGPFNERAAILAKEYSFDEVIELATQYRQQIIDWLEGVDETEWTKPFNIGEHVLTLEEYFTDFAWHDSHHKKQIESIR
ncbi:DinB family protein [Sporosarcina luteola]|uniref:DinB family protein n=1 Tax=Sporosarcina luteola TaxID=582850 RepID=UPI0020408C98|nr:DinB family protein [Sporosarcina luteola]MCM3712185.1 DinB family protein [Sporosarcina luteola]